MAKSEGCKLLMTSADAADRAAWRRLRGLGIGGSDAASIVGVSPWKSLYQLWLEKTGQAAEQDLSDNEAVHFGTVLEEVVAREFSARTGKKVQRHGMLQSLAYPFLLANVDRLAVGEDAGLECKTASAWSRKEWEGDKLPDAYYVQCQHYMMVTGLSRWYIAALIGGNHFEWKTVERNEDDIEALFAAEHVFWVKNVESRVPPDVDGSTACKQALQERVPGGNMEALQLPDTVAGEIALIQDLAARQKDLHEQEEAARSRIEVLMGDHETGFFGDEESGGRVTWKSCKPRVSVDAKRLKAERPDVFNAYAKAGKPYRASRFYDGR